MPTKGWRRVWPISLLTAFIILGGWEAFWRLQGFQPTIQDDWGIWAKIRRQAVNQEGQAIILIGASRIQTGLHPDIFEKVFRKRPLMLAIDGSNPIPVLENLAEDDRISGIIICSFIPLFLGEDSDDFGRSEKWIRRYNEQKWSSRIETQFSIMIEQTFVFRYAGLRPRQLMSDIKKKQWPRPLYAPMRSDRYRAMDFSITDVDTILRGRIDREKEFLKRAAPLSHERFMEKVVRINEMIKKIETRGGKVIFIRLPSTGVVRKLENQTWPRERYWDILAANTRTKTIHFEDYPSLADFNCPDGSHLDTRDAKIFTQSLIDILLNTGALR